jgi:hypothetical protein
MNIELEKYPVENTNECFIRAVTNKLVSMYYGSYEAEVILKWDEEQGFVYVRQFIKALDQYEMAREKRGVNIKQYFPALLRYFPKNVTHNHSL